MAAQITLTQFDQYTKKYVASLKVVTPNAEDRVYFCEGTWQESTEAMIAGALYDQHKRYLAEYAAMNTERLAIEAKITAEVDKLVSAASALEAKIHG